MSAPQLKPETVADLTAYVKAKFGLFGAMHLKSTEASCECQVCAAIRQAVADQQKT